MNMTEFVDEFKLPYHQCPKLRKKNCNLCGKYLGWQGDMSYFERLDHEEIIQNNHDKLRLKEFNSWRLI